MFFEGERIDAVREMILAEDRAGREAALAKILPMQQADFEGIFRAMDGLPVTIRTLDPPLHEFLPHGEAEIAELAAKLGVPAARLAAKVEQLKRGQPDARPPRLPPGHRLSRDHGHAGAGHLRGRRGGGGRGRRSLCPR